MNLQAIDLLWSLCSQPSLLMIIWICILSPVLPSLPQLCLRSAGIKFSQRACNLEPSHLQFIVGLRWECNAAADLTGGGAHAEYEWWGATVNADEAWLTHQSLTSCSAAWCWEPLLQQIPIKIFRESEEKCCFYFTENHLSNKWEALFTIQRK